MAEEPQGSLVTEGTQTETTPTAWYGEESKKIVETKGWKTPDDVIKGYTELEKTVGGRVKMPTPESSAEEIRAFYQKTGCPENPDGYEIIVPEEMAGMRDEGIESVIKQIAYDQGVSKQAFESIVRGYYEKVNADLIASREAGEKALKEELGDKYDTEVGIAQRFCKEACSQEFRDLLESSGLGNNPVFVKEFIGLGKKTMADTLIKGSAAGDADEDSYTPQYKTSPEMYASGEDEESKKARAWFEARGHKY